MGKNSTELAAMIRDKTLALLLEKEPEEISTRDIAAACKVTATSIYYYYKDRDTLFQAVKLCCVEEMNSFIAEKSAKAAETGNAVEAARRGLRSFRDWCLANPRKAILVMGRIKADEKPNEKDLEKYYQSFMFAKAIIDTAANKGEDTLLLASLSIAALWGAIESFLLKRTHPKYWKRGRYFTDKMIELLLTTVFPSNQTANKEKVS